VVAPAGNTQIAILDGSGVVAELNFAGWGPGWSYLGWKGGPVANGQHAEYTLEGKLTTGANLTLKAGVYLEDSRTLVVDTELSTSTDTPLTLVTLAVTPAPDRFRGGRLIFDKVDGTRGELPLPLDKQGPGAETRTMTFRSKEGLEMGFSHEPAMLVAADNAARIVLAEKTMTAAHPLKATLRIRLPADAVYYPDTASVPQEDGFETWFPHAREPASGAEDELSMASWLEAPAGKHGRVTSEGDRLVYNQRPFKVWGINLCYSDCAPPKELAEKRAAFYARNGINSVRLHKYADGDGWAGILKRGRWAEFDPAALDRMDYFFAKLKEKGIYVKLSPVFIIKPGAEDIDTIPYLAEFGEVKAGQRVQTRHGSIYLSRELQDLQIQQLVALLKHRNPYTGLTYAEDPAVLVVELYNEDSALFFGTQGQLQRSPTLRKRNAERFTQWLQKKYGSEAKLLEAWGDKALNSFAGEGFTGESWEGKSIVPAGNPWFFNPEQLEGSQKPKKVRLLDTMQFLYELQNDFYARYAQALRDAGYQGEVLSSNWIAGEAMSHFYNLHSDALIGMIDRHNYFGGMGRSMLPRPGSGIISVAANTQVANRPYMLSEWIHTRPNEFGVEGPAIIGAYGMGLQGWDASYVFQNRDTGNFSERIGREDWDATAPQLLGIFPAVARQVLRGDVRQSDRSIARFVHVPSLAEGKVGFDDRATAEGDIKTADSSTVPAAALAVGRLTVEFTETFRETPPFNLADHTRDTGIQSLTGELNWKPGEGPRSGWFSIDSPGTQAVVGFSGGQKVQLKHATIEPASEFSAIYLTARDPKANVETGSSLLLSAVARARNTNAKVLADSYLLQPGEGPVRMEPVKARITLNRKAVATVHVLDTSGKKTGKTLPVDQGTFEIDGVRDQTCYYLITY
jgi:hypothetical protein